MIFRWTWPGFIPGRKGRAARAGKPGQKIAARIRLTVEVLEDRLLPSTAALPQLSLAQWRRESFTLTDMASQSATGSVQASTIQGGQLIGLDQFDANYAYRGNGYSVAIIDTGIDSKNPDFGGRVVAGWNFVNNSANYQDDNGHGTAVAGIIAGANGVAPDANIIALKVLSATGSGTFGAIQSALDWVVAHQAQYNIAAVNMSLGAGNYQANPYTFLDSDLGKLKTDGVFISVASGNDFFPDKSQQGLAFPAVDPNVVSVGGVWDGNFGEVKWADGAIDYTTAADQITSFTQRDAGLGILAPGAMVTSDWLKNGTQTLAGTSVAAPFVTGAALILHQELDALGHHSLANESSILSIMRATGVTLVDSSKTANVTPTGLSFKRLDIDAAAQDIAGLSAAPTLDPIANQTVVENQSLTLTLPGHAGGGTLTYTAVVSGQGVAGQEYQLKQKLGLAYAGSYYTNAWGKQEKWLEGSGGQWYIILSNGQLRKWSNNLAATLAAGALIATVSTADYNDPSLLWNAKPSSGPNVTLALAGNQLTIKPGTGFLGTFTVQVTASAGQATASESFSVTVVAPSAYAPPTLAVIANQTVSAGKPLTIALSGHGSTGVTLTYTAKIQQAGSSTSEAYQLKQQLGLAYAGSYYTNAWGQQEKWLEGKGGQWYVLLPNGQLRKWSNTLSATLAPAALIATLGASYYSDPSLLWNAQPGTAPTIAVSITGNQLTIQAPTGFTGTFTVDVTVSDGTNVATQSFTVTVT